MVEIDPWAINGTIQTPKMFRGQKLVDKNLGTKRESVKVWGVKRGSITACEVHLFQGY